MRKILKLKSILIFVLLWLPVMFIGNLTAFASENNISVSVNKGTFEAGENIILSFDLNGNKNLSAFIIEIEYPDGVNYSSYERSQSITSGYSEINNQNNKLSFIYTFKDNKATSPNKNIVSFKFKADETIKGENEIKVRVKGALDENGNPLCSDSEGKLILNFNPDKEAVKVTKLIPSSGSLSPSFDPGIFEYKMSVPYSVSSITFDIEYTGDAKASVNRKNLGSGGSTSEFVITVTPEDGEKIIYTVMVTRGEYVRPSSGNKGSTESVESKKENTEIIISESEISEITIDIESQDNSKPNKNPVIVNEEPAEIITETDNGFTAFLFGAGTMIIGIIVGAVCVLIIKKSKSDKK